MSWKTFKEEKPKLGTPIFVYKPNGVLEFFAPKDDIRACIYSGKFERVEGNFYYLKGYDYGSTGDVKFTEQEFNRLRWMHIPKI